MARTPQISSRIWQDPNFGGALTYLDQFGVRGAYGQDPNWTNPDSEDTRNNPPEGFLSDFPGYKPITFGAPSGPSGGLFGALENGLGGFTNMLDKGGPLSILAFPAAVAAMGGAAAVGGASGAGAGVGSAELAGGALTGASGAGAGVSLANSGGALQNLLTSLPPGSGTLAQTALGGGNEITADSIAAGIEGGENAAGAMYGPGTAAIGGAVGAAGAGVGSPGAAGGAVTGAGGAGTAAALSRIMAGSGTDADWLSVLGTAGATGLGIYGANQQSGALAGLAKQYQEYGAPSRGRFEASMTPGFDPNSIPGYSGALDTASKGILAKLSARDGNPWGSPSGLIEANKQIVSGTAMPAIGEYQRLNANTGFGSSMNAALNLQTQGIGADANGLNALGFGLNALTNKQPSLADLMKSLQLGGLA